MVPFMVGKEAQTVSTFLKYCNTFYNQLRVLFTKMMQAKFIKYDKLPN